VPTTYEPIATTTLGGTATNITFSSIPATYTDLKIILVGVYTDAGEQLSMQFNGITTSTYSRTYLSGNGATATSGRNSHASSISVHPGAGIQVTNGRSFTNIDIFSYAGSTNKTCLISESQDNNNTSGWQASIIGLWRNTAAITSVKLYPANTFATGTTATLYGIKNA
jgi:hypothetical protein